MLAKRFSPRGGQTWAAGAWEFYLECDEEAPEEQRRQQSGRCFGDLLHTELL